MKEQILSYAKKEEEFTAKERVIDLKKKSQNSKAQNSRGQNSKAENSKAQ